MNEDALKPGEAPPAVPFPAEPAVPFPAEPAVPFPAEPVLDVRPVLAAGGEPLQDIMDLAQATPPGGAFVVVAPFDPAPLRGLLAGAGFMIDVETPAADHWRVRFTRPAE